MNKSHNIVDSLNGPAKLMSLPSNPHMHTKRAPGKVFYKEDKGAIQSTQEKRMGPKQN